MQNNRRDGVREWSGKYWLAGGVMAAGLGAAVVTGTATATATTDGAGSSGPSMSASREADTAPKEYKSQSRAGDAQDTASDTEDAKEQDTAGVGDVDTELDDGEDDTETTADEDSVVEEPADEDSADEDSADEDPAVEEPAVEEPADEEAVVAVPVVAKDPGKDSSSKTTRTSVTRATAAEVGEKPVAESVATVQVQTAATLTATATATVAAESDPVLVAAATSTKVTIGSMIVDSLYSWGIRSKKMGTDWLDIRVSQTTAARWLVKRAAIYRNVVVPRPDPPTNPTNPTNPGSPANPTNPGSPRLLWETNFSSIEEAMRFWGFQTGRWGQSAGENQYYTGGDNVFIDAAGNLVIEARREATPDRLGAPNNYTSARVVTMGKQSFGVGQRVVARIQMPVTKGVLPAFWSVGLEPGHEYDWPRQGEIDIVEIPTLGTPASASTWTGNIHGPAAANNTVDVKLHDIDAHLGVDLSQGFHDYGIDWHADRIVWHVDGVQVGQITKAQYEALGGNWTPFSGAWEHYLILNVAVGNPWNGDPDPSAPFQAQMKVDWVKAYAL